MGQAEDRGQSSFRMEGQLTGPQQVVKIKSGSHKSGQGSPGIENTACPCGFFLKIHTPGLRTRAHQIVTKLFSNSLSPPHGEASEPRGAWEDMTMRTASALAPSVVSCLIHVGEPESMGTLYCLLDFSLSIKSFYATTTNIL